MLTALDSVASKVGALDGGADDYLAKPFHLDELAARVRACCVVHPEWHPPCSAHAEGYNSILQLAPRTGPDAASR